MYLSKRQKTEKRVSKSLPPVESLPTLYASNVSANTHRVLHKPFFPFFPFFPLSPLFKKSSIGFLELSVIIIHVGRKEVERDQEPI